MNFLGLNFRAPLGSFGTVAVDNFGVTGLFPAASMLTGLFGNALGYERTQPEKLDALQKRLVFGAFYFGEPPERLRDYQTAELHQKDAGWTTNGVPEGRRGGSSEGTHIRYRDYLTDLDLYVVVGLEKELGNEEKSALTLEALERALERPTRPLSFGRKPCLPASPILLPPALRRLEAENMQDAVRDLAARLMQAQPPFPLASPREETVFLRRPALPGDENRAAATPLEQSKMTLSSITDQRNWRGGLHGGRRAVVTESLKWTSPDGSSALQEGAPS